MALRSLFCPPLRGATYPPTYRRMGGAHHLSMRAQQVDGFSKGWRRAVN
jgi:hypothetical protein